MAFEARKQYAYRYSTEKDEVSVWFVEEATRREDPGVVGMFVEMGLESGEEEEGRVRVCEGREVHLCGEDLYRASYRFGSGVVGEQGGKEGERQEAKEGKANENEWWEVRYDVKGPKKDYVSETRYER
jgi:tRNA A64-2'-O-ribosylphosphate transferase